MSLPETVIIKWNTKQRRYYEDKGYIFTAIGDEFEVNFNDIPHSSDIRANVTCDYCEEQFSLQVKKYYRGATIVQKVACKNCANIKGVEVKRIKYGTACPSIHNGVKEKWDAINIPKKLQTLNNMITTFKDNDCTMLPSIYVNNETKLPYICNKHKNNGIQWTNWIHLKSVRGCYYCYLDAKLGENNCNWNGGTTEINHYLRHVTKSWIQDSLKNANYQCDITKDSGSLEVHHLYKNFKDIVQEAFSLTNIEVKQKMGDYTLKELKELSKTCLDLHYKYGLGVCLKPELHKLFHSKYGIKNNSPEQYWDFKRNQLSQILV